MNKRKIALFDLDGTLFRGNSTFDFIAYIQKGNPNYVSFKRRYKLLRFYNKFVFKVFRYDWYKKRSVKFLSGQTKDELRARSSEFYKEELSAKLIPEVYSILNLYREIGYEIGIISASLDFIVDEVARQLGVDVVFATELDYKCDVATGGYENDLLHRKLKVFDQWIAEKYEQTIFISDNHEDTPLLKRVKIGARLYVNY